MNKLKHYFSIQECKTVFWSEQHGILRCYDRLANAEKHGLLPLLVYGVCIEGVPISKTLYARREHPASVQNFLSSFWSSAYTDSELINLSGIPDELVIDKRLNGVLNMSFLSWLKNSGIKYSWSDSKNKVFTSKTRQFQEFPHLFPNINSNTKKDVSFLSVESLNKECLQKNHSFRSLSDKKHRMYAQGFVGRKATLDIAIDTQIIEFDPTNTQLTVKTSNDVNCEKLNLFTPPDHYPYLEAASGLDAEEEDTQRLLQNIIGIYVLSHPIGLAKIAKELGITVNKLKQFISAKIFLSENQIDTLLLIIEVSNEVWPHEHYTLDSRWSIHWCQSVSSKTTIDLYAERGDGGDLAYSHEIVPDNGGADPSFRMLLTCTNSEKKSLFILERGSITAQVLDEEGILTNFMGVSKVSSKVYRQFLKLAIESRISLKNNQICLNKLIELEPYFGDAFKWSIYR